MKNWISSLAIILVSIYSAQPIEAQIFTSKKKAKTEKSKNNKTKDTLQTLITDYSGDKTYTNNMQDLYSRHIGDISNSRKKINDYTASIQTDSRKNFYEDQEIGFSDKIRYYIKIIYYLLLVIYLWYGGFFQNQLYKNYRVWIILVLYILIPFVLKYMVIHLFYLWNSFYYNYINTNDSHKQWFIKKE